MSYNQNNKDQFLKSFFLDNICPIDQKFLFLAFRERLETSIQSVSKTNRFSRGAELGLVRLLDNLFI